MSKISGFARTCVVRAMRLTRRRPGRKTGMAIGAALLTVAIATMAATWFGVGAASKALRITDGEVWLWSTSGGEAQRVNVHSGQVDTRRALTDAQGHDVVVVQTDNHLLLHDRTAGQVTSVDLATLGTAAEAQVKPGTETSVAMWRDQVLLLDEAEGTVRRLDPMKLGADGKALAMGNSAISGGYDDSGVYWLLSDGEAVGVRADDPKEAPKVVKRSKVAPADHKLTPTVLDTGLAVADDTSDSIVMVKDNGRTLPVPGGMDQPRVAKRTHGPKIAFALPSAREVIITDGQTVQRIKVPGTGNLGEAVVFGDNLYVVDETSGHVVVLNLLGALVKQLPLAMQGASATFSQQEGRLLIDCPNNDNALIVADGNKVTAIQKFKDQLLGKSQDDKKPEAPRPTPEKPTQDAPRHRQDRPDDQPRPLPTPQLPKPSASPPSIKPQLPKPQTPKPQPSVPATKPRPSVPPRFPIPAYPFPNRNPAPMPMPMPMPMFPFGGMGR